jgi:hypothetical protein
MPDTEDETYVWPAVEIETEIELMAILEVFVTDDSFLEQFQE